MARYYEKASQVAATCRRVHFFLGFSSAGWCIQWIPHPSFSSGISSLFSWHWAASVVLYCQLFWPRISLLAVLDDYCGRRTGWPLDIHKIKCATWGGEHHVTVRTRHSRVFSQQVHPVGLMTVTNLRVDYSSIKGHRCASYPFSSFRRGVTVSAGCGKMLPLLRQIFYAARRSRRLFFFFSFSYSHRRTAALFNHSPLLSRATNHKKWHGF